MNKLFTKIAGLSLGLAMAIGVGVAVGSNRQEARSVSAAGEKTFSTVAGSAGSYKLQNGSTTTDYWQTDAGSNETASPSRGLAWSKKAATLTYTPTSNVTALSLVGSSNQAGQTIKYKIGSGSYVTVGNMTKENNKTYTFSNFSCASGSQITISITAGSKSTWVKSITITESSGAQKLATPSLTYNDNTKKVSWSVEHASSYQVKVDSGSYATGTSPYDVSGLTTGVSHTIYVIAKGDGTNYTDSDAGQTSFTPTAPAVYTSVTVTGGSVQGADVGSAYIQCSASAQGTNIPASPTFTWYVTETSSYAATTSVAGKASIDTTGKVTFTDSCTVYVWALAPDESTHNTSGYAAVSGNLKGSAVNPYSVTEAWNIADGLGGTGSNIVNNGLVVFVTGVISTETASIETKTNGATFEITDSTKTLKAYSISGAQATNSEASGYVAKDYTVVVGGAIIDYKGTYEVGYASGYNSSLYSSTAPAAPEITALALDTSNVTTQFDLNSTFNYTGLVVTGTVDGVSGVSISSGDYSVSSPDMTSQGQKTVTVTYTGTEYDHESTISASYTITVVVPSPDETIDLIDDIGTVAYTQASYDKIAAARSSYNALPVASQALVTNYSDLEAAESDFEDLELAAVDNVETLITNIGTVTLSSGTAITTAESAYNALLNGDLGKSLVSNYSTLTAARSTYDALVADRAAADAVEALIDALPAASSITDYTHHADIVAARAAYNALSSSAKGMVNATKLQKLVDCETAEAQYAPSVIGTYSKVTDLSQLENGATVIITNADGTVAMGSQASNNRSHTTGAASANANIVISSDSTDIQVFTIESYSTQQNTIVAFKTLNALNDVSGYLYAASSGSNHLKTQASVDVNAKFYVTLSSGNFTVSADDATYSHNIMKYNSSNSLFSCYTGGQTAVALYVKGSSTPTETYTVTYDANGGTGTMTDSNSPYNSGATVTTLENTFTREGYTFKNWSTATDGTGTDYEEGATFSISANTTLYAIWEESGGGGSATAARCYHLVTSTDDLVAGAKYIITNDIEAIGGFYAMSTNQKSNNRGDAEISSNGAVANVSTDDVEVITLGGSSGAWTLGVTGGFLYAASSTANHLKTRESNSDANSEWAITFSSNVASIVAQGSYTRNTMQYNTGSNLFACYGSASQSDIYLYRLDFGETLLHNITCSGSGSYTIAEGYSWNDLKGVYQALPTAEQNSLKTASNAGLERYDYLIAKYGTTTFENFIGRSITPMSSGRVILQAAAKNSGTAIAIIAISAVSLAAIGGYFLFRKKKEN